ncbi:MAG: 50S ribosomal protein L16 [Solitalea-like symbiont of Tyrophagus putrescentiae]
MADQPRKVKYRKQHKMPINLYDSIETRGHRLAFGSYGLKSYEVGRISARQIEAARRTITRYTKREGQLWIKIFPDKPITKKPAEVRMGKGKGAPEYWVAVIKPGRILFELDGISEKDAKQACWLASQKLPIRTKFVKRVELG